MSRNRLSLSIYTYINGNDGNGFNYSVITIYDGCGGFGRVNVSGTRYTLLRIFVVNVVHEE